MKKTVLYILTLQCVMMIFAYQVYINVKELKQKEAERYAMKIKESTQENRYSGIEIN